MEEEMYDREAGAILQQLPSGPRVAVIGSTSFWGGDSSESGLQGRAANPEHRSNLDWLAANFQFTLLLDGVGRKMEPAYRLRERWIAGEIDQNGLMENLEDARRSLERAPLEELFGVFSRRVRSRGELGELSALNQKLRLQHLELKEFLKEEEGGK